MATLASRNLTAVDSAPVNGAATSHPRMPDVVLATFKVATTGTPATFDMRAAVEASYDDGATWMQVVRFADITNSSPSARVARAKGAVAAAEGASGGSALGSAQASPGVVAETPWPVLLRAVTKLETLTGGTSPHVVATVQVEAR